MQQGVSGECCYGDGDKEMKQVVVESAMCHGRYDGHGDQADQTDDGHRHYSAAPYCSHTRPINTWLAAWRSG